MTTKNKSVSLQEFKAWLEGIEELQAKTWSPDKNQWKLIRNKINNIVEPEPEKVYVDRPVQHQSPPSVEQQNVPFQKIVEVDNSNVTMTPEARALMSGSLNPSDLNINPAPRPVQEGNRIKTPNIDTSNGPYNSGFE